MTRFFLLNVVSHGLHERVDLGRRRLDRDASRASGASELRDRHVAHVCRYRIFHAIADGSGDLRSSG